MKFQRKLGKFAAIGIALALIFGGGLRLAGLHPPEWLVIVLASGVVGVSAALTRMAPMFRHVTPNPDTAPPQPPVWVKESESNVPPRHGSRRWARALYHNGLISIEELATFYTGHPEDLRDPDR